MTPIEAVYIFSLFSLLSSLVYAGVTLLPYFYDWLIINYYDWKRKRHYNSSDFKREMDKLNEIVKQNKIDIGAAFLPIAITADEAGAAIVEMFSMLDEDSN